MLIDYKNVQVHQEDQMILNDVNFEASEGEFIYIIGKVGSGKSSFLKTLYCELDILKGEAEKAEVLGTNIIQIKRRHVPALRKQMGVIFQDFQLLHDRTVEKNLRFVLRATGCKRSEVRQRIDEVLKQVGMEEKKYKMPHELSGGEQQRIAIARAILNKPKLIIADEPTGNLDFVTAHKIVALLQDISKSGTTVIMSTHNMPLLDRFPGKVFRCKDGKFEDISDNYHEMIEVSENFKN